MYPTFTFNIFIKSSGKKITQKSNHKKQMVKFLRFRSEFKIIWNSLLIKATIQISSGVS